MAANDAMLRGALGAIEVSITRVHVHDNLMMENEPNRVDPDKWRPLIMSFQHFYGLAPGKLHRSELAECAEGFAAFRESLHIGKPPEPR